MVDGDSVRIAPDVKLGRDVKIYAFVNLYGCEVGDESQIGTFVKASLSRMEPSSAMG